MSNNIPAAAPKEHVITIPGMGLYAVTAHKTAASVKLDAISRLEWIGDRGTPLATEAADDSVPPVYARWLERVKSLWLDAERLLDEHERAMSAYFAGKPRPTAFGAERAKAIYAQRGIAGDLSRSDMTPGEDAYVKQVWRAMPSNTCWMDALSCIAKGKVMP